MEHQGPEPLDCPVCGPELAYAFDLSGGVGEPLQVRHEVWEDPTEFWMTVKTSLREHRENVGIKERL